jgi:hypothetical protein
MTISTRSSSALSSVGAKRAADSEEEEEDDVPVLKRKRSSLGRRGVPGMEEESDDDDGAEAASSSLGYSLMVGPAILKHRRTVWDDDEEEEEQEVEMVRAKGSQRSPARQPSTPRATAYFPPRLSGSGRRATKTFGGFKPAGDVMRSDDEASYTSSLEKFIDDDVTPSKKKKHVRSPASGSRKGRSRATHDNLDEFIVLDDDFEQSEDEEYCEGEEDELSEENKHKGSRSRPTKSASARGKSTRRSVRSSSCAVEVLSTDDDEEVQPRARRSKISERGHPHKFTVDVQTSDDSKEEEEELPIGRRARKARRRSRGRKLVEFSDEEEDEPVVRRASRARSEPKRQARAHSEEEEEDGSDSIPHHSDQNDESSDSDEDYASAPSANEQISMMALLNQQRQEDEGRQAVHESSMTLKRAFGIYLEYMVRCIDPVEGKDFMQQYASGSCKSHNADYSTAKSKVEAALRVQCESNLGSGAWNASLFEDVKAHPVFRTYHQEQQAQCEACHRKLDHATWFGVLSGPKYWGVLVWDSDQWLKELPVGWRKENPIASYEQDYFARQFDLGTTCREKIEVRP